MAEQPSKKDSLAEALLNASAQAAAAEASKISRKKVEARKSTEAESPETDPDDGGRIIGGRRRTKARGEIAAKKAKRAVKGPQQPVLGAKAQSSQNAQVPEALMSSTIDHPVSKVLREEMADGATQSFREGDDEIRVTRRGDEYVMSVPSGEGRIDLPAVSYDHIRARAQSNNWEKGAFPKKEEGQILSQGQVSRQSEKNESQAEAGPKRGTKGFLTQEQVDAILRGEDPWKVTAASGGANPPQQEAVSARAETEVEPVKDATVDAVAGKIEPTLAKGAGEPAEVGDERKEPTLDKGAVNWETEGKGRVEPMLKVEPEVVGAKEVTFGKDENLLSPEEREAKKEALLKRREELSKKVEEMRRNFAKEDYQSTDSWQRLKSMFGKFLSKETDEEKKLKEANPNMMRQDIEREIKSSAHYWQAHYEKALLDFQEADLELVKFSGATGQRLKEEMVAGLQYLKYDEVLNLYRERTKVAVEQQGNLRKIGETMVAIGAWYNSLPKWQRYAAGAILFAAGSGTVMTGGVVGGIAVAGLVGAGRVVRGAGAYVLADSLLEQMGGWLHKRGASKEIRELEGKFSFTEEQGLSSEDVQAFKENLKSDVFDLSKELQTEKRKTKIRKATAAVAAGTLSGVLNYFDGPEAKAGSDVADLSTDASKDGGAASSQIETASGDSDTLDAEKESSTPSQEMSVAPEAGESGTASGEAGTEGATTPEVSAEVREMLQAHTWENGESMWGYWDKQLPDSPDKAQKIQSILNVIQENAGQMTETERDSAGFRSGDVKMVYAGERTDMGRLLDAEKLQAILAGEVVPGNAGAEPLLSPEGADEKSATRIDYEAAKEAFEKETAAINVEQGYAPDGSDKEPDASASENKSESAAIAKEGTAELTDLQRSDPKEYLKEIQGNEVERAKFSNALRSYRFDIILTDEVKDLPGYFYETSGVGETSVRHALAAYGNHSNTWPLYSSQVERLEAMVKSAREVFGKVAIPQGDESVNKYTMRMAVLAMRTGQEIPGFAKVHV